MILRRTCTANKSPRLLVFLLLLAIAGLTGCSIVEQDKIFGEIEAPQVGEPIPAGLWEKVAGTESAPRSLRIRTWPIPWFLTMKNFDISEEGAQRFDLRWYDLGNPLLYLPVYCSVRQENYLAGAAEPDSGTRLVWTPLWTAARNTNPEAGRPQLKAWGVPLLLSHVGGDLKQGHFSLTNGLWTLGPMVMRYKTDRGGGGYVATPLLLGGLLGSILWVDFHIEDAQNRVIGHGPFFSFLGYSDVFAAHKGKGKHQRMILLGTLWYEKSFQDIEKHEIIDSIHGPLWGIFGWGHKKTVPHIRFLWIPIPVGSGVKTVS